MTQAFAVFIGAFVFFSVLLLAVLLRIASAIERINPTVTVQAERRPPADIAVAIQRQFEMKQVAQISEELRLLRLALNEWRQGK